MATYTFQNGDGPYQLFPTTIKPESFKIRHARTTLVADARSMRRQTRSVGGVRIEMSVTYPAMSRQDYETFIEFFRLIDGRHTIFAFRMPLLRPDASYTDTSLRVGEYYNRNSATLNNQLMQYLGLSGSTAVVDPPPRDTGTVSLSNPATYLPTLKASLNTDGPSVEYGADNFIRYKMDLIERW